MVSVVDEAGFWDGYGDGSGAGAGAGDWGGFG